MCLAGRTFILVEETFQIARREREPGTGEMELAHCQHRCTYQQTKDPVVKKMGYLDN